MHYKVWFPLKDSMGAVFGERKFSAGCRLMDLQKREEGGKRGQWLSGPGQVCFHVKWKTEGS